MVEAQALPHESRLAIGRPGRPESFHPGNDILSEAARALIRHKGCWSRCGRVGNTRQRYHAMGCMVKVQKLGEPLVGRMPPLFDSTSLAPQMVARIVRS